MNPEEEFRETFFRQSQELARRYGAEEALRGLRAVPGQVLTSSQAVIVASAYVAALDYLSPIERGCVAAAWAAGHRQLLAYWTWPKGMDPDAPETVY